MAIAKNHWFGGVCRDFFGSGREAIVLKEDIAGPIQRFGRSECECAIDILRRSRHPGPLCSVERQLFSIHRKKVLPKKHAKVLKNVAKSADNRIVFPDGLFALGNVQNVQDND